MYAHYKSAFIASIIVIHQYMFMYHPNHHFPSYEGVTDFHAMTAPTPSISFLSPPHLDQPVCILFPRSHALFIIFASIAIFPSQHTTQPSLLFFILFWYFCILKNLYSCFVSNLLYVPFM